MIHATVSSLRLAAIIAGAVLLASCASMPDELRGNYPGPAPIEAEPADVGEAVRWGGRLIAVRPQRDRTCFEILSRELDDAGRPRDDAGPGHRFLACQSGFADPAAYRKDAEITVTGRLSDFENRSIGEFDYRYPVVDLDSVHVWAPRPTLDRRPYPPWWYDPYWGFRPWYYP